MRVSLPLSLRLFWAAPCSIVGLAAGLIVLVSGGSVQRVGTTLEFTVKPKSSGKSGAISRALPFDAITLGHVIIGITKRRLAELRAHELVHVAQYERWGPLFFLAYPAASLLALLRGKCAYRGNAFEVQAFEQSSRERGAA